MKPNPKNIVLMVALAAATQSQAQTWTGTTNQEWTTTTNWSTGSLPGVNTKTYIDTATGNTPIITTAVDKSATVGTNDLWIGSASGKTGVLTVDNGGALNSNGTWLIVGNGGGTGTLNVNAGGSVTTNNNIRMAQGGGSGTLNVNGGSVTASNIEAGGTSSINVTNGGTISVTAGDVKMRNSTNTLSGSASSIAASGQVFVGVGGGATTLNMSGGSLQTGTWFVVGINSGVAGTLNMSGGTVTTAATNASAFSTIGAGGSTGTVNLSGGTYNDMNKTLLGENTGGTGNFNLNGGTLHTKWVDEGAGTGNFNFNGGTLKARENNATFLDAALSVNILSGGAKIDSNGFAVTVPAVLPGAGGLEKLGTGSLTLSAANTYTGATTVSAGSLIVSSSLTSNITVASGAQLAGVGSTTGSLTMNAGSVLAVNTSTEFTANGVTIAGATELLFQGALTPTTVYDVVTYGAGGLSGMGNLVQTSRGSLSDDTVNKKVTFTAGSVLTDTWNATSGNWQAGSGLNWGNGDDNLFWNTDSVIFDDTPGADSTVNVVGSVVPAAMTVSGSTNHTFNGSGAIAGTGSLSKSGTGTLTINTANTFSGGSTISAGKVVVGNATALGTGSVAISGSTLELNNVSVGNAIVATGANTLDGTGTLSGAISGAGSFTKEGTGSITLSGANTFSGGLTINAGTVVASNIGNLGGAAANVTLNAGALNWAGTLDFGGGASYTQTGGAGTSTVGEFWVGGTGAGTMTMSGGSLSTGSWFVVGRNGTGTLNMTGGNISSSSSNAGSFAVLGSFGGSTGTANISGGTFASSQDFYVGEAGAGILNVSGTGAVTAADGVRLGVNGGGSGVVNLDGGSISTNLVTKGAGTGTFNFNGGTLKATANNATFITGVTTDVKAGGAKIDSNGFNITSVADLTGVGSLEKLSSGALTLAGSGNNVASVAVSAGTLFVTGQLSAASGVTVADGATIGGNGTVNGNLTIADGGMIDFSLGALAVNSSSTVSFGGFTLDDVVGFDKNTAVNGTYTILSGSFTLDSANIANFGLANAFTRGDGKQVYFEQGSLNIVVIPETSSILLGLTGSLLLLRRRRN
jgi:autotransporter-associated beta strand protein/T5SS/PEP-CTERM-associated repeat protein